jgi:hypothetical protein
MSRKDHSFTADYFAVGVIGYEFMLGRRPYVGRDRKEIREHMLSKQVQIRIDELPFKWSPNVLDFVNRVLPITCSCFLETHRQGLELTALMRSCSIRG